MHSLLMPNLLLENSFQNKPSLDGIILSCKREDIRLDIKPGYLLGFDDVFVSIKDARALSNNPHSIIIVLDGSEYSKLKSKRIFEFYGKKIPVRLP